MRTRVIKIILMIILAFNLTVSSVALGANYNDYDDQKKGRDHKGQENRDDKNNRDDNRDRGGNGNNFNRPKDDSRDGNKSGDKSPQWLIIKKKDKDKDKHD